MTYTLDDIKVELGKVDLKTVDIIDQSSLHASHYDGDGFSPSHIKVVIYSNVLQTMKKIDAHRYINNIFKPFFEKGLHALQIDIKGEKSSCG